MLNYSTLPHHNVLCIDMKSFYASCECVFRGLDPLTTYLVVIGDKGHSGGIVLAASPKMKKDYGIKTGNRFFEVPRDPRVHLAEARMALYLEQSIKINQLLNEFVPLDVIHVYSVDEFWICVDGTERLFGDKWEVAQKIKDAIRERFGLPSCIGIGPNKFLSKVILDIEAKQLGIAECQYEDVQEKIWPQPVEKIWGIGRRMKGNLNQMGILTVGHLAQYPLEQLKKRFGVMGEQLHWHAWGVDLSPVTGYHPTHNQKGFGHGITLLRDYKKMAEIKGVILELCEEVARRAREVKMAGRTVGLSLSYGHYEQDRGFSRSFTRLEPTNITSELYADCLRLFHKNYKGEAVRKVYLSLTNLVSDKAVQLNLFEDREKSHRLGFVVDEVRAKYGSTSLLRAQSYTDGGVMRERAQKIGGHKA